MLRQIALCHLVNRCFLVNRILPAPRHNDFRGERLTSAVNRGFACLRLEPHNGRCIINLFDKLTPGEEVVIIRTKQPIARLVGEPRHVRKPRQPGSAKDKILYMADNFDAPLEDFTVGGVRYRS